MIFITHTGRAARMWIIHAWQTKKKKGYFQWNTDMMLFKSSEWSVKISGLCRPGRRTNDKFKTVTSRVYSFIHVLTWISLKDEEVQHFNPFSLCSIQSENISICNLTRAKCNTREAENQIKHKRSSLKLTQNLFYLLSLFKRHLRN